MDTSTSGGNLIFQVFGAVAEFERNQIRDRTEAGLSAAPCQGQDGRETEEVDEKLRELAIRLYNEGGSVKDILPIPEHFQSDLLPVCER